LLNNKVKHNFNRFAHHYDEFAVVQEEIAKRLFSRLEIITSKQEISSQTPILELGSGTGLLSKKLLKKYSQNDIIASDIAHNSLALNPTQNKLALDAHNLPFNNSFNSIMSNLMMQWCDVKCVAQKSIKSLQPNGLFLFSTFGPQTLIELKESWRGVDNHHHVHDFIDMHDIGDTLLEVGLRGVVVESEIITLTYEKVMDLLLDLKYIGAQNIQSQPISKSTLQQMINNYEQFRIHGKLPASYEVIYAHGFKSI
jgi:malonyl-CoA O-methyltransferase